MQPLDLVSASPWQRAIFTTYALSLSFFEAVVLDRLVRGGARNALILADPEGIRAGLSEQGARRAGRDYELEPIACTTGVFHPKLSLFLAEQDAHLLVGSGNLTFGGWGMNLETVDHLHPSFAADAFDDAADMFELMAIADNVRTGVADQFGDAAAQIRGTARNATRNGEFRLLHSVGGAIGEQLTAFAEDLGGATRLTIVSPYFDTNGGAVARLVQALNCDDVRLHAHPTGPVKGLMGTNWPEGLSAAPVCIDAPFGDDPRHLHAKCFEVLCRRGRLIMSGSANATRAALFSGNIEASLVRIQRETLIGWDAKPAPKPISLPLADDGEAEEAQERVGILRAVLEGDRIAGQIIVPRLAGEARLSIARTTGFDDLGRISIDSEGKFEITTPDLEMQSWSGGRMVLRVDQNGRAAEGFVSIATAAKIMQKAGPLAPRLLAMLAGTETPEDVAAILTWFKEDPDRIVSALPSGGHTGDKQEREATWVSIEQLKATGEFHSKDGASGGAGEPEWQRALWLVRSAFSQPRGPWKSGTGEDDQAEEDGDRESESERQKRLRREEDAKHRAMKALDGLLDEMLAERHKGRHATSAFALTHYLVDRIRPAPVQARNWLVRIFGDLVRHGGPPDTSVVTAGLLLRATDGQERAAERSRRYLLQAGLDPVTLVLECEAIPGFVEVLGPAWDAELSLTNIRSVRTAGEEVRAYLEAAGRRELPLSLPGLERSPHWYRLAGALNDAEALSRFQILDECRRACPKCNLMLPTSNYEELRQTGVTRHCRIILSREL
jgi:hypothetical protein